MHAASPATELMSRSLRPADSAPTGAPPDRGYGRRAGWLPALILGLLPLAPTSADQPATTTPTEAAAPPTGEPAPLVVMAPQRLRSAAESIVSGFKSAGGDESRVRSEHALPDSGALCLIDGTCDALLLPRPTVERERRLVRHRRSKELIETPFAVGAVTVVVHADNPIGSLTLEQVAAVFQTKANRWSDLDVIITAPVQESVCVICQSLAARGQRAALAEGHTHAVDRTLNRIVPGEDTGAPGAVRQLTLAGDRFGSQITWVGDGFEVQRRVAEDPLAIGLVPWGTADLDKVKVVPIRRSADASPIAPSDETIRDRTYPLAHYLYWCTAGEPQDTARALRAFALSPEAHRQFPRSAGALPIMPAPAD